MSAAVRLLIIFAALLTGDIAVRANNSLFDSGKLLGTPGVVQIEGAGGSGLSSWAMISGYGTNRQIGASVHYTVVPLNNFTLSATGVSVGIFDRLEISYTQQRFDTNAAGERLGLGRDFTFGQDILGAKLRVFGDAVYGQDSWLPQVSFGAQYKRSDKSEIVRTLGATEDSSIDLYAVATKIMLDQSLIFSAGARLTSANQFGLLGFGSNTDTNGSARSLEFEGSVAYLLSRRFVLGLDYRSKPDNLTFAEESDAFAAYLVWLPSKHFNVTAGYTDLGKIALQGKQRGLYLSLQLGF